ncbi:M23 family metallopeptidase [Litorihabitans aurantiacus]|uniref:M23ase beta-sheet core domain-containing protein n=1 Tax=Litorihabitans aurantiacus TaxID=1930061 RepID=A0AA37XHX9_9MICO|nr:M23 family metallopeptidase [Litorihabitans aurantiacus]GMA33495.1 hypothetical protein GCM10025875_34870 [Litorihabitans aurantiacus]GMA33600.1 hypothetical protein GCM10025875_35920 [Litorihabitans aurantiacus]
MIKKLRWALIPLVLVLSSLVAPANAATVTYAKYTWSDTVYRVTDGQAQAIDYNTWVAAGRPTPTTNSVIPGSYLYKWGTHQNIGLIDPTGAYHWLSSAEWNALGTPGYANRSNEGFVKLSWDSNIARMTDLNAGQGYPINLATWRAENSPEPRVANRFTGDQFYKYEGSDDIWYAGPTVNRVITFAEWQAAGSPAPRVIAAQWANPITGRVQGNYGQDRGSYTHYGEDIAAPRGTAVRATGSGTVVRTKTGVAEGSTASNGVLSGRTGNAIMVHHDDGTASYYGHLQNVNVSIGQRVTANQQIATSGNTGNSTGPHLHFEIHLRQDGNSPTNPRTFLLNRGVTLGS